MVSRCLPATTGGLPCPFTRETPISCSSTFHSMPRPLWNQPLQGGHTTPDQAGPAYGRRSLAGNRDALGGVRGWLLGRSALIPSTGGQTELSAGLPHTAHLSSVVMRTIPAPLLGSGRPGPPPDRTNSLSQPLLHFRRHTVHGDTHMALKSHRTREVASIWGQGNRGTCLSVDLRGMRV